MAGSFQMIISQFKKRLLSKFKIRNIVSHGYLSGSCKIVTNNPNDRLRCVIEAAKRLHLADDVFVDRFPLTPVTELLYLEKLKLVKNYRMTC